MAAQKFQYQISIAHFLPDFCSSSRDQINQNSHTILYLLQVWKFFGTELVSWKWQCHQNIAITFVAFVEISTETKMTIFTEKMVWRGFVTANISEIHGVWVDCGRALFFPKTCHTLMSPSARKLGRHELRVTVFVTPYAQRYLASVLTKWTPSIISTRASWICASARASNAIVKFWRLTRVSVNVPVSLFEVGIHCMHFLKFASALERML